jgi:diguanylate cyclase (GGDEF)-like protein
MIKPRGDSSIHIPSDLTGILMLDYDAKRADGNLRAAVATACDRIREIIQERGAIRLPTEVQIKDNTPSTAFTREDRGRLEAKVEQIAKGIAINRETGSILFIDFDRFAALNRWYGVEVCDEVIAIVEELITKKFDDAYWQRVGGDQYLICCRGVTGAQAMRVASRLVEEVKKYDWSLLSPALYVTISVGVAEFKQGQTVDHWIVRAIHGSINAKRSGGCRSSRGPFEVPLKLRVAYEVSLS